MPAHRNRKQRLPSSDLSVKNMFEHLLDNHAYADIQLECGRKGAIYPAHKFILSRGSTFFRTVLESEELTKNEDDSLPTLTLYEDFRDIHPLLQFLYTADYCDHIWCCGEPQPAEGNGGDSKKFFEAMRINVSMYKLSFKYGMPELGKRAVEKHLLQLSGSRSLYCLIKSAQACYDAFPGRNDAMRIAHVIILNIGDKRWEDDIEDVPYINKEILTPFGKAHPSFMEDYNRIQDWKRERVLRSELGEEVSIPSCCDGCIDFEFEKRKDGGWNIRLAIDDGLHPKEVRQSYQGCWIDGVGESIKDWIAHVEKDRKGPRFIEELWEEFIEKEGIQDHGFIVTSPYSKPPPVERLAAERPAISQLLVKEPITEKACVLQHVLDPEAIVQPAAEKSLVEEGPKEQSNVEKAILKSSPGKHLPAAHPAVKEESLLFSSKPMDKEPASDDPLDDGAMDFFKNWADHKPVRDSSSRLPSNKRASTHRTSAKRSRAEEITSRQGSLSGQRSIKRHSGEYSAQMDGVTDERTLAKHESSASDVAARVKEPAELAHTEKAGSVHLRSPASKLAALNLKFVSAELVTAEKPLSVKNRARSSQDPQISATPTVTATLDSPVKDPAPNVSVRPSRDENTIKDVPLYHAALMEKFMAGRNGTPAFVRVPPGEPNIAESTHTDDTDLEEAPMQLGSGVDDTHQRAQVQPADSVRIKEEHVEVDLIKQEPLIDVFLWRNNGTNESLVGKDHDAVNDTKIKPEPIIDPFRMRQETAVEAMVKQEPVDGEIKREPIIDMFSFRRQ
ncbi:hypothetical protein BJ508DRAFT_131887 [Ascobolus immersus RN42]|uniref:BTB domain-containing protein n=1 Tax=Ascobolus immersus RN42 TaxID=1160509 RepID=A0A3N4I7B2_ASCIM|nr:hypothetical protein BJ508DRAFT_131887 [Ascobolus immersus RN42]